MAHDRYALGRVVTATALLAAGALAAIVLPTGLATALGLLGLLRICWLEDNIKNDLVDRDGLPSSYLDPMRARQRMAWHVLGLWPDPEERHQPALIMATAMRGQIHAWSALLLAGLSVIVARDLDLAPVMALAAFGLILRRAFRHADALDVTLRHLDAGRPLPARLLVPVHSWAYSTRAPSDD